MGATVDTVTTAVTCRTAYSAWLQARNWCAEVDRAHSEWMAAGMPTGRLWARWHYALSQYANAIDEYRRWQSQTA